MRKKKMAAGIAALTAAAMLFGGSVAPQTVKAEAEEEVTLRFLGWKTGKEEGAIPDIIKAFEEANPGVTVEYEAIPTSNNYQDVLNARLSTGECADVFMASEAMLKGFVKNDMWKTFRRWSL